MTAYRIQYRGKNLESLWPLAENIFRRGRWKFFAFCLLALVPLFVWHARHQNWLAVVVLILWYVWLVARTRPTQQRKSLAQTADMPDAAFAVLPEGLLYLGEQDGRCLHSWQAMDWVKIQPEGIFVQMRKSFMVPFMILPRVCFESDAAYEAFEREFDQARARALANPNSILPLADESRSLPRFELQCSLTAQDYALQQAQLLLLQQHPETVPAGYQPPPMPPGKKWLLLGCSVLTILILIFGKPWLDPRTLPMQENFICLVVTFLYALGLVIVYSVWKAWRDSVRPALETTITLNDLGYTKRDQYERDQGTWGGIDALIEEPKRYTLWKRGAIALIVPRRSFASEEDDRACRNWMLECIPRAGTVAGRGNAAASANAA